MRRIGDLLIAMSACTPDAIREALYYQDLHGARLGTNLLELGAIDERILGEALRQLYAVPVLTGEIAVDGRALQLVPRVLVEKHEAVPYAIDGRALRVLMCDPGNVPAIDEIAFSAGSRVQVAVAPEARIWALMWNHYRIHRGRHFVDPQLRVLTAAAHVGEEFTQPLAADVWEWEPSITPRILQELRRGSDGPFSGPRTSRTAQKRPSGVR